MRRAQRAIRAVPLIDSAAGFCSHPLVKFFPACVIFVALTSCTTLSNRRDLYMPNHEVETQPHSTTTTTTTTTTTNESMSPNPPARSPAESQIIDPQPE